MPPPEAKRMLSEKQKQLLKQWIEQDRESLRIRRRLDEAVSEWLEKDRDPSFLLGGGRLIQAEGDDSRFSCHSLSPSFREAV